MQRYRLFRVTSVINVTTMLVLVAAACGGSEDNAECVPMAAGQLQQAVEICPAYLCGSNSAEINDLNIGELHVTPGQNTGQVNAWGAQLIDFIGPDGSRDYVIYYDDGQLVARSPAAALTGEDLIGAEFIVRNTYSCEDVHMRISDYDQKPSWTTPAFAITRYVLTYELSAMGNHLPVCLSAGEDLESDDAWAVLVGGERYTWDTKIVAATGDSALGWFNLACSGNALYKMKFMGYEPLPSEDNSFSTTADARQAALKTITGDYCGTGLSFTETGTLVHWVNQEGWSENAEPPESVVEAYWGKDGALCLATPRLMDVTRQE